jgi:hypothetical protein
MSVVTQIQVRRGTASQWTSTNPTLASGEWGFETDTGKVKIGNGSTVWTGLAYVGASAGTVTSITAGTGLSGGTITSTGTIAIDNTVATLTGSQTLTNKTLTTPIISSISNSGTVTIPTGTVTLATLTGTETFTNKTLTAPIITIATNAQTASYTLVLADQSDIVEISNASANTLTVPVNSSVAFPVGTTITILQTGAGQTTLTPDGGVTINGTPGLKLRAQWSSATLIKRATDTWVAIGDLSA